MTATAPARNWSAYQQRIFDFGLTGYGSAQIVAVAGSGKTSTIEELARRMPADEPILYLVFNKRNADEAKTRMPNHVNASTFHAACNAALQRRHRVKVDGYKVNSIIREGRDHGGISRAEFDAWAGDIQRLVGLAKNAGIGCLIPDDEANWWDIVDHFDIDFDDIGTGDATARAIEIARKVLANSNEDAQFTIDFDDMLYLCVKLNVTLPQYGVIFVDEAQDTNSIQRAILRKMLRPGGRLIAVGDPRQAIYGFRGASADAMELIETEFNCTTLPLSVNYRCSRAVIDAAKAYCPEIEAHDNAPDGSVEHLLSLDLRTLQATDAVLCRTTAPIITLAYRAIGQGIPCTVLGREIGQGLIKLIRKLQGRNSTMSLDTLLEHLDEYGKREIQKVMAKGQESKAQQIDDKVQSLHAAASALNEDSQSIDALIAHIEMLFDDTSKGRLTLATVHKSKGLEWENVYILNRDQMPSRWARQSWQQEQEENLIYVAYTRAKVNLYTISLDDVK